MSINRLQTIPWGALAEIREAVLEAISANLDGQPIDKLLTALLRGHRSWSSEERRVAKESLFGVSLWRLRLAYHANLDRINAAHAAALLASLLYNLAGLSQEEVERLTGQPLDPQNKKIPAALGLRHSLPTWIAQSFARDFPNEAEALAEAINQPGPVFLRANLLKTSPEALRQQLLGEGIQTSPCRFASAGLRVESERPNIYGSPSYQKGLFEVQDEGSQLLAELVEARPSEAILDLCAGAGGKTLALASRMQDRGQLFAYDIDRAKLRRLQRRAQNAGARCVRIVEGLTSLPAFDAVLVDAPCSELGALRRGPEMRFRMTQEKAREFLQIQLGLLQTASLLVRRGGRLVYATCTLRREENQEVIEAFLQKSPGFSLVAPGGWLHSSLVREGFFLSLPHLHQTDGFFAAVLSRL